MAVSGRCLVTGGAGYIGTHACIALHQAGHDFVVLDNFSASRDDVIGRLEAVVGRQVAVERGDIRDAAFLDGVFQRHRIDAVMHFAGLKSIGESTAVPVVYYDNNIGGTLETVKAMERAGVRRLIFSSSAAVYGPGAEMPVTEDAPCLSRNPYGKTKLFVEHLLSDLCASDPAWSVVALRYFNPVGAHETGLLGEDPLDFPSNLVPCIAQVAMGHRPFLRVHGDDYATDDGTGVRDYIHVMDLAEGHVAALRYLQSATGYQVANLGTGQGVSVLQMLRAFERACGFEIPYRVEPRRPDDVAACWASVDRASALLGWRARRSLDAMCEDTWRWQDANRRSYGAG